MVLRWNDAMIAAVRTAGQVPPVAARSAAIVQAAVYEAVNSIDGSYTPYLVDIPAPAWASEEAATAQAAHDALVGLFPAQKPVLDLELKASLQLIGDGDAKTWGIQVGQAAAQILLAVRANDGSNKVVVYTPGNDPGDWQPTPPAYAPPLVPQWPGVTPFALQSGAQFRPPPPPALDSPEYLAARDQVMSLGAIDSTTRTADQTEAAMFWQGIVTPNSGPFWWNEIAQEVAVAQGNTLVQNARLFALLNMAGADALIASFDGKYAYNFWRPVTAIRYDTDPSWTPLMATPSHPSYPSNHSSASTASAVVLASFFGTDAMPFSLSWDGLPGVTRYFDSFSQAAQEAGQARIWAGFHYSFDVTAGEALGTAVGSYVMQNFLLPQTSSALHRHMVTPNSAAGRVPAGEETSPSLAGEIVPALAVFGPGANAGFVSGGSSFAAEASSSGLSAGPSAVYPGSASPANSLLVSDPDGMGAAPAGSEGARTLARAGDGEDVFLSADWWEGSPGPGWLA
jgi:membrane-associated phospholipid phosphatase